MKLKIVETVKVRFHWKNIPLVKKWDSN